MKRYYLITFSWSVDELSKVKEYKVFTDPKEPLREIASDNVIQRDIDDWISNQIDEIKKSECSSSFKYEGSFIQDYKKYEDGLYRIVVTSDYPEKSKSWRKSSHNLAEVLCAAIIEPERDIKIDNILNHGR